MWIEFVTQAQENYGSPERPHWKCKFGGTYLLHVHLEALNAAPNRQAFLNTLVDAARPQVEESNSMYRQWIVDWQLVEDDHLTDSELDQLEFDGEITYWATEIVLEPSLVSAAA